ncbi:MAG: nucleotidyltransferase family protein [Acidobacteria bacterium]|nr:nucleotidyltransferase family protein [Acidobacteriota bacterium]
MADAAVLLAAGASRRLGRPKQLEEIHGEALIHRAARLALEAGFSPVLVVLGHGADRVGKALEDLAVQAVHNPGWEEGMASSIRAGVSALPPEAESVLLLVCDQLALARGLLETFRAVHAGSPGLTLASAYEGGLGVPALFPRARFPELMGLRGDRGAKGLLEDGALGIPFPGGERDLDLPGPD